MAGKVRSKVPANAVHPGEILREEFMVPLGLTSTELAKQLHITVPRANELVRGRRSMTAASLCAWRATSGHLQQYGWDCRLNTI